MSTTLNIIPLYRAHNRVNTWLEIINQEFEAVISFYDSYSCSLNLRDLELLLIINIITIAIGVCVATRIMLNTQPNYKI